MQIYKFGGTSLGNASRICSVKNIVNDKQRKIIVLSANGKITDDLKALATALNNADYEEAMDCKQKILQYYYDLIGDLFYNGEYHIKAKLFINSIFEEAWLKLRRGIDDRSENWLLSCGEIISTSLFSLYLRESDIPNVVIPITEILRKNSTGHPDSQSLQTDLLNLVEEYPTNQIFITQGFICLNHKDEIDNLGRGGSDYTATLLGMAINASVIQIWSDVDGFLNNDPAYISDAVPLKNLSFNEAAELAYFGARILHPSSAIPAKEAGIPVLLKNTLNPASPGTVISNTIQVEGIKAIAAKDGITSITIHSGRMLLAHGFLKKVFEIFDACHTAVDMVTTSEVSVAVTIDNTDRLVEIISALQYLGEVSYSEKQSIVCIVGNHLSENQGQVQGIFTAMDRIPVRMISYGASNNSISMLVDAKDKARALEVLNFLLPNKQSKKLQYA